MADMRKRMAGWLLYILMLAGICAALLWARGAFLPSGTERTETVAFDDGVPCSLSVADSVFTAEENGTVIWQSDPGWHVQDFLTCDIDRDDHTELLLLVWRRGNYGPSKPFWVKRNDTSWSQHIFIFDRQDGIFVPQWMSSQLRPKVACWSIQGNDQLFILTPDGTETLWQWDHWGLVRTDTP